MASHDRTRWVPAPVADTGSGRAPVGRDDEPGGEYPRLGRYRLVEEVGEGGMGVVHLGIDPRGRAVAIKVLRAHVAHDDDARQRLRREVETLSRVRDARVASVIDADVMGPRPYIVTRYVPGPALDETVEERGPLDPDALLRLARGTAEAIRAIHACGVVHRDIKPGNVLLEAGEPVLIDFGIAHLQDDVRHTMGGLVMGTPGYLSPELVEGAPITEATDWWGWAATISFAASGRPPFGRGRMDAVLTRVRAGEVDLAGVDPRLVPLLRASLSPNPTERPHAGDVVDALERYAAGQAATVPTPTGRAHASAASAGPGATEVLAARGTAVFPELVATQGNSRGRAAAPPPMPLPAPVVAEPGAAQPWEPPTGPAVRRGPSPAAYAPAREDEGWDDALDDDGWDDSDSFAREGDPRIGMAKRTRTLAALTVAWVGALALWPGPALLALFAWSTVARGIDRSMTGLVLRRYDRGRRRTDVPWAVATSPWHLVVGAVATLVALLLPVAVALAGVFSAALLLGGSTGGEAAPGAPATLLVGGLLGVLTFWWGPGGASLRRGSRSIVRHVAPAGTVAQVTSGLLVVLGLVLAAVALNRGEPITWQPFGGGSGG